MAKTETIISAYARGGARRQIDELLAAIDASREAAAKAYEFSGGNAYAYAAVQACTKAAMLAKRILGDGQQTRLRRTQATVRTPRQGEVRKSMDKFKRLLRTMVKRRRRNGDDQGHARVSARKCRGEQNTQRAAAECAGRQDPGRARCLRRAQRKSLRRGHARRRHCAGTVGTGGAGWRRARGERRSRRLMRCTPGVYAGSTHARTRRHAASGTVLAIRSFQKDHDESGPFTKGVPITGTSFSPQRG